MQNGRDLTDISIIRVRTSELIPYENNPRENEQSVPALVNCIKRFGFKVPVVIDANKVIVCGHTRWKAAQQLGLEYLPCVLADDLTPAEIKAFRLADNKVSELSGWDFGKLEVEIADIPEIDLSDFGFVSKAASDIEPDSTGYYGDERERTNDAYNLGSYDPQRVAGFYQIPTLTPIDYIPKKIISFNYMLTEKDKSKGVHFYCDDYQFERLWSQPQLYIDKLKQFDCVFTPNFSAYLDMPMSMKIWNVYRNQLLGQMMQDVGARVIPSLLWAERDTFKFCFDGVPKNSTVAVSTIGVKNDKTAMRIWLDGMDEAMSRLSPKNVIVYGGRIDYDFGSARVAYFDNETTQRMSSGG